MNSNTDNKSSLFTNTRFANLPEASRAASSDKFEMTSQRMQPLDDDDRNGHYHDTMDQDVERADKSEDGEPAPKNVSWKARISHFTWPWFGATMSTGSVAVVLAQTPNQFRGCQTIGKIFFILDLVLFVPFTALICTRFIIAPKKLWLSMHHPVEGLFFGTYWVSIALIINCIQLYGVSSSGTWLVTTLRVLFWIYSCAVLIVAIFQYFVLFQNSRLSVNDAMPAWIFPIYPLLVVGTMAGVMIDSQPKGSAYPMWAGAVMFQGLAWAVSFMMYTIYTQRLMTSHLPTPSTRPGMFVSVGPGSFTSAALISLASQAPKVLPADVFSTEKSFQDGQVVKVFGTIAGGFTLLFGFWFFCISTVAVITGIRRMSFTLNWWAFIFPNGGLTLAVIQLGTCYHSPGVNWVASVLTILMVIMWFVVVIACIRAVWKRQILWPGKDEDADMKA